MIEPRRNELSAFSLLQGLASIVRLLDQYYERCTFSYSENPTIALSQFRAGGKTKIAERKHGKPPEGENLLVQAARRKGLLPEDTNNN